MWQAAGRVAVEKPFGHDLDSARALDARLHRVLRESLILRVDHFLGKEPVVGLEYLRFANFALAELWDRKSVSCMQITRAFDPFVPADAFVCHPVLTPAAGKGVCCNHPVINSKCLPRPGHGGGKLGGSGYRAHDDVGLRSMSGAARAWRPRDSGTSGAESSAPWRIR